MVMAIVMRLVTEENRVQCADDDCSGLMDHTRVSETLVLPCGYDGRSVSARALGVLSK